MSGTAVGEVDAWLDGVVFTFTEVPPEHREHHGGDAWALFEAYDDGDVVEMPAYTLEDGLLDLEQAIEQEYGVAERADAPEPERCPTCGRPW